jgi:hypothetical protein
MHVLYYIDDEPVDFFSNTRQNGEWTETSTCRNELELTIFGKLLFFLNSPTNTK